VRLPARGMGLAVVVRDKKGYADMQKKLRGVHKERLDAQMKHSRDTRGKHDPKEFQEFQRNVMMPLQHKQARVQNEYSAVAKKMFGAFPGHVIGDWVCAQGALEVVSGAMRATKAEDFEEGEPQFTSFTLNKANSVKMCISMVNDSAIVRFKVHGLWANTCFDVAVIPVVMSEANADEASTAELGKGEIAGPVRVWTTASEWQRSLEQHGLTHLITSFQDLGLTDPEMWMPIVESPDTSAAKDLDLDPVTIESLKAIISDSGFITKEEKARLELDRIEIQGTAKNMIQAFVNNTMSIGDPVRLARRKTVTPGSARRKMITAAISAAAAMVSHSIPSLLPLLLACCLLFACCLLLACCLMLACCLLLRGCCR
jgi:hypothetical protein